VRLDYGVDVGDWITECRDLAPFWGPENRPDLGPFWPGFWDSQIGVFWFVEQSWRWAQVKLMQMLLKI
jgi:hypothetical protein